MKTLSFLRTASTLISALILCLLPILVAMDFGGVLRWTQYVAALAILAAFSLAIPALTPGGHSGRAGQCLAVVPLLVWLVYAWMQTWILPPSVVSFLSPGSFAAYTDWLAGVLDPSDLPEHFPISIAVYDSRHAVAVLGILIPLSWASSMVFNTRGRLILLFSAVAISGALLSLFGTLRLAFPDLVLLSFVQDSTQAGAPFGSFVNRNNAALMLNIGLAASLGLLSWRLTALTGQELDDNKFEFNDLFSLSSDRESAIGMISGVFCILGLLVSGSRGGLGAALVGALFAFGWVRRRRGFSAIPVVGATVAVAVAILVAPLRLDFESIKRMKLFSSDADTLLQGGRFDHWPEGWSAALAHLPMGSGLSSYSYAYLPYQQHGSAAWFHHADNLWLELFTEQGFFGILLTLVLLWIFARAIRGMAGSHDALDHGVQTTGWYCFGSILFSQTFDFGLIVPANLFLITIVVSAVVARHQYVLAAIPEDELPQTSTSRKRNPYIDFAFLAVTPVLALVFIPSVLSTLRRDTHTEFNVLTAENVLGDRGSTPETIRDLLRRLSAQPVDANRTPQLSTVLAELEYRIARIDEVDAAAPKSLTEAAELYELTGPVYRRLLHSQSPSTNLVDPGGSRLTTLKANSSDESYLPAYNQYVESLNTCPLGLRARSGLLYLDFVKPSEERTKVILEQLRKLYNNNPEQIIVLGNFASQSGMSSLAAAYWRDALVQQPALIGRVLQTNETSFSEIGLEQFVPDDPTIMRRVARSILNDEHHRSMDFLPKTLNGIGCDQCSTIIEKSKCLQLKGDIAFALEKQDDAFEYYEEAVRLTPMNANLRYNLVSRLRTSGKSKAALQQARMARQTIPSDHRFDRAIKEMARIDDKASDKE